jgi:protocatechuate 4,5-dioxygenase, alpha chain
MGLIRDRMRTLDTPTFDLNSPGSIIYDGELAARGMRLNRFGNGMKLQANRDMFRADPAGYVSKSELTEEEAARILARDWSWLLKSGGHVQALARIAAVDGQYLFHIAAHSIGVNVDSLRAACPRRVSGLGDLDG